jgi:CMP-N-acetylneuraminic acid synthetase
MEFVYTFDNFIKIYIFTLLMKIYAIVPIKHNSTRVPGKNYRLMNGKPLFYYIIDTLYNCQSIDKIIIDTNSPIIKLDVSKYFNMDKIIIYDRPQHLCHGDTPTNDLLINIITELNLDADYYLQTHVTNPLLKTETIENSINKFINQNECDTLFSVKTHYTRLYDKNGHDMNHNRFKLIPTQNLDPIYEENSCIYIFSKKSLLQHNSRISNTPILYEMSTIESQDIDWEEDFILTEILMKTQSNV